MVTAGTAHHQRRGGRRFDVSALLLVRIEGCSKNGLAYNKMAVYQACSYLELGGTHEGQG